MKIGEISSAQLPLPTATNSSSVSADSEYAKILAEKIANARTEMEQMDELQDRLDEIADLHEELTGKRPDSSESKETSTIKRFMPDGSILFLTVQDGKTVQSFKKKPHLTVVADPSAPKTASGQVATKLVSKPQLDLADLLM